MQQISGGCINLYLLFFDILFSRPPVFSGEGGEAGRHGVCRPRGHPVCQGPGAGAPSRLITAAPAASAPPPHDLRCHPIGLRPQVIASSSNQSTADAKNVFLFSSSPFPIHQILSGHVVTLHHLVKGITHLCQRDKCSRLVLILHTVIVTLYQHVLHDCQSF